MEPTTLAYQEDTLTATWQGPDAFYRCSLLLFGSFLYTLNHLYPASLPNLRFIFKGKLNLRFAFYLALENNKLDLLVDYCSNLGKFMLVC